MNDVHRARAISPQGEFLIRTIGRPAAPLRDLFHDLLVMSWPSFLLRVVFVWLATNIVFATIYRFDPGGVANMRAGSYADAFFFSVHHLADRTGHVGTVAAIEAGDALGLLTYRRPDTIHRRITTTDHNDTAAFGIKVFHFISRQLIAHADPV